MRGRKPTPVPLKLVRGNPGKRSAKVPATVGDPGVPEPPVCLDDEALAEWLRVGPALADAGVLTPADRGVLAAYCQSWSAWVEAERNIKEFGRMLASPRGLPILSPWLQVSSLAQQQFLRAAAELGLTPVARARVSVKPPKKANPFEVVG